MCDARGTTSKPGKQKENKIKKNKTKMSTKDRLIYFYVNLKKEKKKKTRSKAAV